MENENADGVNLPQDAQPQDAVESQSEQSQDGAGPQDAQLQGVPQPQGMPQPQDVPQPQGMPQSQDVPQPPPAYYGVPVAPKGAGKATAALVCGIVSIVTSANPLFGIGFGVAAVVLASMYAKQFGKDDNTKAKGGRICGIVGIVFGVLWGIFWTVLFVVTMSVATSDQVTMYDSHLNDPSVSQDAGSSGGSASSSDDDDVIIAGSVDTSSKYTFSVDAAVVGVDEYSSIPVVVLVGEFTNDSDKTVSFSEALSAEATQDGYSLDSSYLAGAASFNYESIAPGKTVPVFVGWELWDGQSTVEIEVFDQYHYAKQSVYQETFTIDELLANTRALASELDGIINEDQELTV